MYFSQIYCAVRLIMHARDEMNSNLLGYTECKCHCAHTIALSLLFRNVFWAHILCGNERKNME